MAAVAMIFAHWLYLIAAFVLMCDKDAEREMRYNVIVRGNASMLEKIDETSLSSDMSLLVDDQISV